MRGSQKHKDYKVKWTPEFAYAVGLITSDGSLSKDGRHIIFVSKDKSLVKTFKRTLNLNNKIGLKGNGSTDKKIYNYIQFSNVKMYRYLRKIGLKPNKNKTLRELKLPSKHFFDFLRGCFDGDGSCYSYWDKRWPNSFMFYTIFSNRNLTYIQWLQQKIKELSGEKGSINPATRTWQLEYPKYASMNLWEKMYYKDNIPFLARKKNKIKNILKTQAQVMETGDISD